MNFLPKELEDIIIDYKYQIEQQEKYKVVLNELVDYVPEKRKCISYEYDIENNFLSITNRRYTYWGKRDTTFWGSEECKKYMTDSRIESDVSYYGIFENNGKIWWEY